MSSRPNPTFDDSAGFRETYLRELPPERRELLRQLSAWWIELARESGMVDKTKGNRPELAAIAADLRHCAGALYHAAWSGTQSSLSHSGMRRAVLAGELAPQVEALARTVETALGSR